MKRKKIKNPTAEWLIKPMDSSTNQIVAQLLAGDMDLDESITEMGGMYSCKYRNIQLILDSANTFNLRVKVYRRRTPGHKLEEWPFGKKRRNKK